METHYFGFFQKPIKHSALTKYIRRHGVRTHAGNISLILKKCIVDDHIGGLPPELLSLIKDKNISEKTAEFFDIIDTFVYEHKNKLNIPMIYDMPEIGDLFNTDCFVQVYEKDTKGEKHYWSGVFGDVYKICFPKMGVNYALKVFKHGNEFGNMFGHGPIYEIANAFAANKSEPKFNNSIYMAKLMNREYMISRWLDADSESDIPTEGPFTIYSTTSRERRPDNYINKKRIDFGETQKTPYGKLSYMGRKFYRQMFVQDIAEIQKTYDSLKTDFDKSDFESALKVFIQNFGQQSQPFHEQYSQIQDHQIQRIQQIQNLMHR